MVRCMEKVPVNLSREDVGNLIDDARRFIESLEEKIISSPLARCPNWESRVLPLPSGRDRPKTGLGQQGLVQPVSVQLLKLTRPSSAPLGGGESSCRKTF